MKKLYFLFAATCILVSCSSGGNNAPTSDSTAVNSPVENNAAPAEGKYGIKSGILTQEAEAMGMKMNPVVYFDDYGKKECTITSMEMFGVKSTTVMISKDGYIYNYDLEKKTGTKIRSYANAASLDFKSLSDEMKKKMNLQELGEEEYLGKKCKKYTIDYKDLDMKGTFLVYENIPLKSEATIGKMATKVIVTKIIENAEVPAERFDIPTDVKITDADAASALPK